MHNELLKSKNIRTSKGIFASVLITYFFQILIVPGIYLHDLIIIAYTIFMYGLHNAKIPKVLPVYLCFVMLLILISLINIMRSNIIEEGYFLLPYKLIVIGFYGLAFRKYFELGLSFRKGLFFLFGPLLLSMVLYYTRDIPIITQAYPIVFGKDVLRFGGVFGNDVVTFGAYGGILATFFVGSSFQENKWHLLTIFAIAVMAWVAYVSLTRTGMLNFIVMSFFLLVVHSRSRISFYGMSWVAIFVLCAVLLVFLPQIELQNRFNIELLVSQAFSADGNHIGAMYVKYIPAFWKNITITSFLFGMDLTWLLPDSLYLYLFGIYGFSGFFILIALVNFVKTYIVKDNVYFYFLLLSSLILSLKGLFVISNYMMFLSVYFYFVRKEIRCQKSQY